MTGFGLLVSFAFTSLIIIQFFGYVVGVAENAWLLTEISKTRQHHVMGFEVNVETVWENRLTAKTVNRAGQDILGKNLRNADLFLVYFDENGRRKVRQLNYIFEGQQVGWRIISVKFGDSFPEILDPVVLQPAVEGVWNVGETLYVEVYLDEPLNTTMPVLAKLWVIA